MNNSSILLKIEDDFKEAMRNKQELKKSTLRLLKTAISTESKKEGKDLTDTEVVNVIMTSVKSTEKQIQVYKDLDQQDIVNSLNKELEFLKEYLPQSATEEEIDQMIDFVFSEGQTAMGPIIKRVKELINKPLDSKLLAEKVKNRLNA